jgi:hypothetical protein
MSITESQFDWPEIPRLYCGWCQVELNVRRDGRKVYCSNKCRAKASSRRRLTRVRELEGEIIALMQTYNEMPEAAVPWRQMDEAVEHARRVLGKR